MAFANNSQRIVAALAAIASTSIMIWFGNGLEPWWPLLWFAPLPVLLFALRSSWVEAAVTSALSMLIGSISMWHYFHEILHAPPFVWIVVYSVMSVLFALVVLLFRALVLRGAPWSAMLAIPSAWVTIEYLRNIFLPHGTAGSLAYTQLNFLPFLQLASITGPWGMTFLLLLFSSAIAIAIHLRHSRPSQALQILGTSMGIIAAVLVFGAIRLAQPQPTQQARVGFITSDERPNDVGVDEAAQTERLFRDYAIQAQKLTAQGAQAIVMPEKIGVIVNPDISRSDAVFQTLADSSKSTIVAGVVNVAKPLKYNQARVYLPGNAVQLYNKHHMLPPFESDLEPGKTLTLLPKDSGIWGVAICKDMDFTPLSRRYGNAGVGLMLVPAWDFNVDRGWHGHIAVMRGVESGFSIARAAKFGYLTLSDDRGRILSETRSDTAPFATQIANVPTTHDTTLYLLFGDWFVWLSFAILIAVLIQLYRRRHSPA
jgi:apolipoprotein N-acyltransferase